MDSTLPEARAMASWLAALTVVMAGELPPGTSAQVPPRQENGVVS
jgi:hypothetical protein